MAAQFEARQGYYSSGNDISTGWHTLTEAKRICAADDRMVGFCFQGEMSAENREPQVREELADDSYEFTATLQLREHRDSYYGAGNDVATGSFTLAEAKRKCLEDPYCEGFCFHGDASGRRSVHCFFKSGNTGCSDGAGWTRFTKPNFCSPAQSYVQIQIAAPRTTRSAGNISCEGGAQYCDAGYAQRTEACLGEGLCVPIKAFDLVPVESVAEAKRVVESMLRGTPGHIKERMVRNKVHVGVIGRNQMTLDLPPYEWLRGGQSGDGRGWNQTRGLGATVHCPCSSIAEENLMMYDDDRYSSESIMVHEFAHSVMNCGFNKALIDKVQRAYDWCKARPQQFDGSQYWMSNIDEFWAELTQGWFHGSIRTDVNNGIITRDMVRNMIPLMDTLFTEVYGSNPWVYANDCPHPEKWH